MKKKMFFRLLMLLLCLALLGVCAVACTPADDQQEPQEGEPEPLPMEDAVILAENGTSAYQIVRSDFEPSKSAATLGSVALRAKIQELSGVELAIGTDYEYDDPKYGLVKQDCEILFGKTNRPESETAMAALGDYDYSISVIGTKICVVGNSERAIKCATEDLIKNHLKVTEDGLVYVSKEMKVMANTYIPEGTYFEVKSSQKSGADKYDEALALACLQGIMNRESPAKVYVNSGGGNDAWLKTMQEDGRWLHDVKFEQLSGLEELLEIGGKDYVKAVCIWDEDVPATVNVATTVAGVEDGLAMTWSAYQKYKRLLNDDIKVINLLGMFDGSDTGSAKNDAYLWAIENYLEKGLCSTDVLCHYMDAWSILDNRNNEPSSRRLGGDDAYVAVRDLAVYERAFVIDLSPWDDEAPLDDTEQEIGTDAATFDRVLQYMMDATKDTAPFEMAGFFDFTKYSCTNDNTVSKHQTVPTEWQYVWRITPYNGYHNTCIEWSWNQSFHCQYDGAQQLTNNRPDEMLELEKNTTYLCFFMADYDSTYPLYRFLQEFWDDPKRGEIPLAWGINPNLLDMYPDIIEYYYETATPNDFFTSDASCAGYFNPSRVPKELRDLFVEHNLTYFRRADMSIAPMVLDRYILSEDVMEMFSEFAPDGVGVISMNVEGEGSGRDQPPTLYDGVYGPMAVDRLDNSFPTPATADSFNNTYSAQNVKNSANSVAGAVRHGYNRTLGSKASGSSLAMIRCVWTSPSFICDVVEQYKADHPNENVVVVDIYNYFNLLKQDLES